LIKLEMEIRNLILQLCIVLLIVVDIVVAVGSTRSVCGLCSCDRIYQGNVYMDRATCRSQDLSGVSALSAGEHVYSVSFKNCSNLTIGSDFLEQTRIQQIYVHDSHVLSIEHSAFSSINRPLSISFTDSTVYGIEANGFTHLGGNTGVSFTRVNFHRGIQPRAFPHVKNNVVQFVNCAIPTIEPQAFSGRFKLLDFYNSTIGTIKSKAITITSDASPTDIHFWRTNIAMIEADFLEVRNDVRLKTFEMQLNHVGVLKKDALGWIREGTVGTIKMVQNKFGRIEQQSNFTLPTTTGQIEIANNGVPCSTSFCLTTQNGTAGKSTYEMIVQSGICASPMYVRGTRVAAFYNATSSVLGCFENLLGAAVKNCARWD